jgi:crossover junction endodeoxyribonuclease RusA
MAVLIVELPYPHKALWPNGRAHHHAKAREVKEHRKWAWLATLKAFKGEVPLPVQIRLTVHPKARGPLPDQDNCSAALKSYLDGIADAINVNDRDFAAPLVSYSHRTKHGGFVIEVG